MRLLKPYERKLLKKVDLFNFSQEKNVKEAQFMRRFRTTRREYETYSRLTHKVRRLASLLLNMDKNDPYRMRTSRRLLDKLYEFGVIPSGDNLLAAEGLFPSAFARRRLPLVMLRNRMATNITEAITYIDGGHVRIGPDTVKDPAALVPRAAEDYVTWTNKSTIRRKINTFEGKQDDYAMA